MRQREGGHHTGQLPEAPNRQHETEQEEQVIEALKDVFEPESDERPRGLEPRRIQMNQARIADELKRALRPVRRFETK